MMAHIAFLRYSSPKRLPRPTPWAADWRRRWFRQVGSVHRHHATDELVVFFSNDRPPDAREALQRELEAHPGGVGQVLAVCRTELAGWQVGI